jgi:hypothetical protein
MAYAQLVFPSTPQAGQVLKGIIKVLTGEKNLANIEGVTTSSTFDTVASYQSVILNANNETWTLAYPASGLPAAGSNVVPTATVSSPCINTARPWKYVRFIISGSGGLYAEPINTGNTYYANTTNYGIQVQGLSAVDGAAGTATNPTYRNNSGAFATIKKATSTTEVYAVNLSWSARHLFVSSTIGGRTCFHFTTEFDETGPTAYANVAPCLHITGGGSTTQLTSSTVAASTSLNVISVLGAYDAGAAVPANTGIRCLTSAASGSANSANFNSVIAEGLTSGTDASNTFLRRIITTGKNSWLPAPIVIDDTANGNGIIDCSKYSNTYLFIDGSFTEGYWIDTNNVNYKGLNIYNSALTDYSTILVKYG